jgi:hypothetical protein
MLSRAAAAITFILKRLVTDATERMLKLLTKTNIGGLKAAPPPQRQSLYSHVYTLRHTDTYMHIIVYILQTTVHSYNTVSSQQFSLNFYVFEYIFLYNSKYQFVTLHFILYTIFKFILIT